MTTSISRATPRGSPSDPGGPPPGDARPPRGLIACRWTPDVSDPDRLAIGVFETSAVAHLLHPEHGATGCPPGTYVVRRQREHEGHRARLVAD
ncbi:hypothetical protein ACFQX6_17030 [Streptosporangium lutulentum]